MKSLGFALIFLSVSTVESPAGCIAGGSLSQSFADASNVVEIRPVSSLAARLENGSIITRHTLSVIENFKGAADAEIVVESPGGTWGEEVEFASNSLDLKPDRDYVLHLTRGAQGRWKADPFSVIPLPQEPAKAAAIRTFLRQGAIDPDFVIPVDAVEKSGKVAKDVIPGSRITPTGYFEQDGIPRRFIEGDEGMRIPYLIDIDVSKLPTGITQQMAVDLVGNAFAAWAASSSLRFRYAGLTTAGAAASNVTPPGHLLIQLHDTFNAISGTTTLGIGGGGITFSNSAGIYTGGRISGQPFNKITRGYVVMNHRSSTFNSDPALYAEVLTHEVGHALGLEHSSEDPSEPDAILKDATMYFTAHDDGRNAAIRAYDADRILFGYPTTNTPPFSMSRIFNVVTGSPQPTGQGVDRITIFTGDLQTPSGLTLQIIPGTTLGSGGTWSVSGNFLIFTPAGNYADNILTPQQIQGNETTDPQLFSKVNFQITDGVNISPAYDARVVGFENDSQPSDGLPDTWMNTYFGSISPGAVGSTKHPDSDPDNDGLSNRVERFLGTNPLDPKSGPPKLTYNAQTRLLTLKPMRIAPHVIERSTNLSTWAPMDIHSTALQASPADVTLDDPQTSDPKKFYRVTITP